MKLLSQRIVKILRFFIINAKALVKTVLLYFHTSYNEVVHWMASSVRLLGTSNPYQDCEPENWPQGSI